MNARRVAAAEGVILAAMKTRQTAASIAIALDSAQLLQSPESATAIEIQSRELSAALAELKRLRARVAELEAGRVKVLRDAADAIVADNDRKLWASKPGKHWAADLLRRMANEDPHDGPLHHDYALGRELPEVTPSACRWCGSGHDAGCPYGECPSCAAPADATGTRIPSHREGCPREVTP